MLRPVGRPSLRESESLATPGMQTSAAKSKLAFVIGSFRRNQPVFVSDVLPDSVFRIPGAFSGVEEYADCVVRKP